MSSDLVDCDDSYDESAIIKSANSKQDLLSDAGLRATLTLANEKSYRVEFRNVTQLTELEKFEMFALCEQNMRAFYETTWGWNAAEKHREIFSHNAKFLLILDVDCEEVRQQVKSWVMFKFDWDDLDEPEHPVCFVYELQVRESERSQSIGTQVMTMILEISQRNRMWKTMLTCFKINTRALDFYRRIGFDVDVNSPSKCGFPDEAYEILSDKPKLR